MAKSEGAAVHDDLTPIIKVGNAGGGMSASENRMVNHRGRIIYNSGPPKKMDGGKSLGPDAKNVIMKLGLVTTPVSPAACTPNKGARGGRGSNAKNKGYK